MNTRYSILGVTLFAAGLSLSGCYTQFVTEKDPYAEREQVTTTEDTSGAAGYYDSRERFYSEYYPEYYPTHDYYCNTHPFSLTIGASFWGPWYPGYGYGQWWYYDPWYSSSYYYPGYYGGYWGGGYYPYYGGQGGVLANRRTSGVRTFGSGRYTGTPRTTSASGSPGQGLYRPPATTTPAPLGPGVRAVTPRGGSSSGREGGSRPAPSTTKSPTRTGSARDQSRSVRVPAYVPPPPPSRETPRQSADRPSSGSRSYSPPPSSAPSHSSPPPSSSPREGGSKSGDSGSGRSGSRR
jgi:hypothetical protein